MEGNRVLLLEENTGLKPVVLVFIFTEKVKKEKQAQG